MAGAAFPVKSRYGWPYIAHTPKRREGKAAIETIKNGLIMCRSRTQDLLVVSDIHGFPETFVELLDAGGIRHRGLQLASLSGRPDLSGDNLHDHLFNKGGLQQALRGLLELDGRMRVGIGFSAGGTALWNAVKEGLELKALICVSSTRLRLETSPLNIPTMVLWGEADPYRPTESWNNTLPSYWKAYAGKQHDFYRIDAVTANSPLRTDIAAFIESLFP